MKIVLFNQKLYSGLCNNNINHKHLFMIIKNKIKMLWGKRKMREVTYIKYVLCANI